jgi:hypothetical protein
MPGFPQGGKRASQVAAQSSSVKMQNAATLETSLRGSDEQVLATKQRRVL